MSDYGKEPAYPLITDGIIQTKGITKLEHFAGLALNAMIDMYGPISTGDFGKESRDLIVKCCYDIAQAMCDEAERRSK